MSTAGKRRKGREKAAIALGGHAWNEWQFLLEYCRRCVRCGTAANYIRQAGEWYVDGRPITMDHIVPISRGGSHSISNLQPLCPLCNSLKGAWIMEDWRPAGWQEAMAAAFAAGWWFDYTRHCGGREQ